MLEKHVLEAKVWKEVPEGGSVVDVSDYRSIAMPMLVNTGRSIL